MVLPIQSLRISPSDIGTSFCTQRQVRHIDNVDSDTPSFGFVSPRLTAVRF